jgi:hypothetical protein
MHKERNEEEQTDKQKNKFRKKQDQLRPVSKIAVSIIVING